MKRVDAFLDLLTKQQGSDLHLVSGNPPRIRLFGEIHPVKYRELTPDETRDLLYEIMSNRVRHIFIDDSSDDGTHEKILDWLEQHGSGTEA